MWFDPGCALESQKLASAEVREPAPPCLRCAPGHVFPSRGGPAAEPPARDESEPPSWPTIMAYSEHLTCENRRGVIYSVVQTTLPTKNPEIVSTT
eukprot:scaffold23823_cov80-Phaeocystis_antarctica.AAC.1